MSVGVLCIHGFTGSPNTMRPVADAVAAAGFDVSLPRLPGHGTTIEDMVTTTWADWSSHVETAYCDVAARHDRVVLVGLSMGGTLAAWLGSRHPEIDGIVFINPAVLPIDPTLRDMIGEMISVGDVYAPGGGVGSDIADPDAHEEAYTETPLVQVLSLFDAIDALQPDLAKIACPAVIMTSVQDHVIDPTSSDHLAERLSGPVERVMLERSYHVATHDYDKQLVIDTTLDFIRKIASA